jgi:hypothetical protein
VGPSPHIKQVADEIILVEALRYHDHNITAFVIEPGKQVLLEECKHSVALRPRMNLVGLMGVVHDDSSPRRGLSTRPQLKSRI